MGVFFCYNLAHGTGRNMEMSCSLVEEIFACLHALPVHVGQILEEIFWESPTKLSSG